MLRQFVLYVQCCRKTLRNTLGDFSLVQVVLEFSPPKGNGDGLTNATSSSVLVYYVRLGIQLTASPQTRLTIGSGIRSIFWTPPTFRYYDDLKGRNSSFQGQIDCEDQSYRPKIIQLPWPCASAGHIYAWAVVAGWLFQKAFFEPSLFTDMGIYGLRAAER